MLSVFFSLPAQDLKEFEKKVTEFTLANGLHFIVVERHEAPVVSFHTYVNAGSVDDPSGQTGLAHMFEHMAFKGTEAIGTKDWPNERKALESVEEAYDRLESERSKGPRADEARVGMLGDQLHNAIDRAQTYVVTNDYTRIIEENGGADVNAGTSLDSTEYHYSLPSNRIELWFLLESQRFLHPVFREFYNERDVVIQEDGRAESQPMGRLEARFLATAFAAHPYRNPPGGWPSDVANLRSGEARRFFEEYYVAANIAIAIVGDVDPAEAKRMAEKYFGPMPARPLLRRQPTREPAQDGPKTVVVIAASNPVVLVGYKRPDEYDRDDPVFDIISLILSSGRTGLLYKDLVRDKRIALEAQAGATFPGGRYDGLFAFLVVPGKGHTAEENQKALDDLLTKFKAEKPDQETLNRAKAKVRAELIRRLTGNAGLASLLTTFYASYGDWRKLFTSLDDYNRVTADDVERVAQKYFVTSGRTVAYIQPAGAGGR